MVHKSFYILAAAVALVVSSAAPQYRGDDYHGYMNELDGSTSYYPLQYHEVPDYSDGPVHPYPYHHHHHHHHHHHEYDVDLVSRGISGIKKSILGRVPGTQTHRDHKRHQKERRVFRAKQGLDVAESKDGGSTQSPTE